MRVMYGSADSNRSPSVSIDGSSVEGKVGEPFRLTASGFDLTATRCFIFGSSARQ
ncbi:MAG: hypothetical protein CM1200mP29_12510 [Verrucomicrobiota bacterium]|nr:MAG: hypothetical protein CM1200mP29_12510 [Verrucomicrobiota bacterium]